MNIERYETMEPASAAPLGIVAPIINQVTAHGDIVYGERRNGPSRASRRRQTTNDRGPCPDRRAVAKAGTSKANLLAAQVWLTDMSSSPPTTKRGTAGSIPRMRRSAPVCCRPVCGTRG